MSGALYARMLDVHLTWCILVHLAFRTLTRSLEGAVQLGEEILMHDTSAQLPQLLLARCIGLDRFDACQACFNRTSTALKNSHSAFRWLPV